MLEGFHFNGQRSKNWKIWMEQDSELWISFLAALPLLDRLWIHDNNEKGLFASQKKLEKGCKRCTLPIFWILKHFPNCVETPCERTQIKPLPIWLSHHCASGIAPSKETTVFLSHLAPVDLDLDGRRWNSASLDVPPGKKNPRAKTPTPRRDKTMAPLRIANHQRVLCDACNLAAV